MMQPMQVPNNALNCCNVMGSQTTPLGGCRKINVKAGRTLMNRNADSRHKNDYIFKRYGRQHVCILGSYATFQSRAVVRELGKVFGLPKEEIDQLTGSKLKDDKIQKQILYYSNLIKNFPDPLSIHASGMLIDELLCTRERERLMVDFTRYFFFHNHWCSGGLEEKYLH